MGFKDLPVPQLPPLPFSFADFSRPVIITKEYYDKLPEGKKCMYELLHSKGGNNVGSQKTEEV